MGWEDFLCRNQERILPWTGGGEVCTASNSWRIEGARPSSIGWYLFEVWGRKLHLLSSRVQEPRLEDFGHTKLLRGYTLGSNRFISDKASPSGDILKDSVRLYCCDQSLPKFSRVTCVQNRLGQVIFLEQEWGESCDDEVLAAYEEGRSIEDVKGVSPALHAAYLWCVRQDLRQKDREERLTLKRREQELQAQVFAERDKALAEIPNPYSAQGRRVLAQVDFDEAAKRALASGGGRFLSSRDGHHMDERIVRYLVAGERIECVVDAVTLSIKDSGVCLTDEITGEKGDERFTLESLPSVIQEASDQGVLVIWRRG